MVLLYENCQDCKLCKTRKNIVFSSSCASSKLMIIGEAPGADEDEQGLPFVGRAGKFLTQILDKAGLNREEIYITNVVKCRPPKNRKPEKDEIRACQKYLFSQIEEISPKIIVLVGSTAMNFFIHKKNTITSLRGKVFDYNNIKLIPVFHPSYLLRKHSDDENSPRSLTIRDFKMIKEMLKS